jgi:RNA polymerase sigma-70 factor, ECF subfamily
MAAMEDWSDERLLAETPSTPSAFAVFYRRHEGAVLGYFMRRAGNADLAADLTAETFAAALLGAKRYRPDRGEGLAWLYGIARHRLMRSIEQGQVEDRARRKLALPRLVIDDEMSERIERLGAEERALELLERLPPDQADAVRARVLEQRSYKEIAASVRVSEAVVRKRVSRGLLTLRGLAKGRS